MNSYELFKQECAAEVGAQGADADLRAQTRDWFNHANAHKYSYHFEMLGRPIIQYPQDIVAMQELIWQIKPDLIIETGIAHGGSLILSASMMAMLDYCDAVQQGVLLDPANPMRKVLGIDIDIRDHNKQAILAHPMASRIEMIQGSSVAPDIVFKVKEFAKEFQRIMVVLDSNHTHDHVLAELDAYAPLTSKGSYCVVFDTVIEDLPEDAFPNRPWGKGDNAKTAVWEYLKSLSNSVVVGNDGQPFNLEIDHHLEDKLLITVAPDGFLKRV